MQLTTQSRVSLLIIIIFNSLFLLHMIYKNTQTILCLYFSILLLRSLFSVHVDPHARNTLPKFPARHKRSNRASLGSVIPSVLCSTTERVTLPQGFKQNFIPVSKYLIAGETLVYNSMKRPLRKTILKLRRSVWGLRGMEPHRIPS